MIGLLITVVICGVLGLVAGKSMAESMSVVYLVFLALVLAINNRKLKTAHQSQILAMALVIYLENQNVF